MSRDIRGFFMPSDRDHWHITSPGGVATIANDKSERKESDDE
jgi:hypothetical protein